MTREEIIEKKKVDMDQLLSCNSVKEYNRKYASWEKITDCPKKNRGQCNHGWGMRNNIVGCEKAKLTEEEYNLLRGE